MVEETAGGGTCLPEESRSPRAEATAALGVGVLEQERTSTLCLLPAQSLLTGERAVPGSGTASCVPRLPCGQGRPSFLPA